MSEKLAGRYYYGEF